MAFMQCPCCWGGSAGYATCLGCGTGCARKSALPSWVCAERCSPRRGHGVGTAMPWLERSVVKGIVREAAPDLPSEVFLCLRFVLFACFLPPVFQTTTCKNREMRPAPA